MRLRFAAIRTRMPEVEETLDELLTAGEDSEFYDHFVEACEDYEACLCALEEPLLKEYAEEFRRLSGEIEQEIRRYVGRYSRSRRPGRVR